MIINSVPNIRKEVIVFKKEFNNELILRTKYSLDRKNFTLNPIAKEYFELCDGNKNCAEIIKTMSDKFPNIPDNVLKRDFKSVLLELSKRGIIEWKDGMSAFDDESKEEVNGSVFKMCNYNEVKNLLSNYKSFPVCYISPYYGESVLKDNTLLETYMVYNNMFIFQIIKENKLACEILCESSYIDFSIQIAFISYDNTVLTNNELQTFFKWILYKIINISKPKAITEKKYLFAYSLVDDEYEFLKLFMRHGVLKKEIKNCSDIVCYTFAD